MFPQGPRNPTTDSHDFCFITSLKYKTKLLKIVFIYKYDEVLEEAVNKFPNKIYEKKKQWEKNECSSSRPESKIRIKEDN